ncbi:hypothetical protein GP486_006237 [Trichoglossum hirsutum]|uniref:DUF6594 domain-containing protein n=1 Tax=Trichoglossum hirsutum TaxID=265104 RepID=A0A9P8IEV0_9PEZI|nr:hypothetical protein GP486_006237 [Trichoglossum hirsutum]
MDGYDKLADLIGKHHEMVIFRRFSVLNAKNLLYLQAELVNLEEELKYIVQEDKSSGDEEKQHFPYSLWHLKHSLQLPDGRYHIQWRKVLEIREKLKEYNDALIQQSQIAKFEEANKADLKGFRRWLGSRDGGNFSLENREANTWEEEYTGDLISLISHRKENDCFTMWIRDKFVPWFHDLLGYRTKADDEKSGLWEYRDSRINRVAHAISAVISSLLPTSAIFVLYFLHDMKVKLGVIIGFTALFSLALVILVRARRIEVFAASTA